MAAIPPIKSGNNELDNTIEKALQGLNNELDTLSELVNNLKQRIEDLENA